MLHSIDNINFNVVYDSNHINNKIPILFLHGFTGSVLDWEFLSDKLPSGFTPIFLDLMGHGKTDSPNNVENYNSSVQVDLLNKLIDKLNISNFIISGYSMGGRLALSYAFRFPDKIQAIVLESSSFGIEKQKERYERIKSDELLSEMINNSSLKDFIDYWMNIPLFSTLKFLPSKKIEEIKKRKIKTNNQNGLKNSLVGFSTGKMKNYFPLLFNLPTQTLLITGKLDSKFTTIAKKADRFLPNSVLKVAQNCGHNVHLEKPEEFLKLLNQFLLNIREFR